MMLVCMLDFQANRYNAFDKDKKQQYCGDLVWGWGVLPKDCFQPLVNRISIKTLKK